MASKTTSLLQIRVTPKMLKSVNATRKKLGFTIKEYITRLLAAAGHP